MNNDFGGGIGLLQLPLDLVGDFVGLQAESGRHPPPGATAKKWQCRSAGSAGRAGRARRHEPSAIRLMASRSAVGQLAVHQVIQGLPHNCPGAVQNIDRYGDSKQRVKTCPALHRQQQGDDNAAVDQQVGAVMQGIRLDRGGVGACESHAAERSSAPASRRSKTTSLPDPDHRTRVVPGASKRRPDSSSRKPAEPAINAACPRPASASALPWPKRCSLSAGVIAWRTATRLISEASASSVESIRVASSAHRVGDCPGDRFGEHQGDRNGDRGVGRQAHQARGLGGRGRRCFDSGLHHALVGPQGLAPV